MTKDRSVFRQGPLLIVLITVQSICAAFFLNDAITDFWDTGELSSNWHMILETTAAFGLIIGVVFEVFYLFELLRHQAHLERGMSLAQGALHDVTQNYFRTWGLTPSERDVAGFVFKGSSIAEIAELRGSAEGTVKTHLSAIYRKAGVSNRGELISLLIEDLMQGPLLVSQESADALPQSS